MTAKLLPGRSPLLSVGSESRIAIVLACSGMPGRSWICSIRIVGSRHWQFGSAPKSIEPLCSWPRLFSTAIGPQSLASGTSTVSLSVFSRMATVSAQTVSSLRVLGLYTALCGSGSLSLSPPGRLQLRWFRRSTWCRRRHHRYSRGHAVSDSLHIPRDKPVPRSMEGALHPSNMHSLRCMNMPDNGQNLPSVAFY